MLDMTDPLARLPAGGHPGGLWIDPIYRRLGYTEALPAVWVRGRAIPQLLRSSLAAGRHGHGLLVWDGWRPLTLQRVLYERYKRKIADESGLTGPALDKRVAEFVTDPDRLVAPPAHVTGGAVDVTLCDPETGVPRDLGGQFDELTERSHPTYYDGGRDTRAREFSSLRQILLEAMLEAEFVRLGTEWWHFEYGTALWASERGRDVLFDATDGPRA